MYGGREGHCRGSHGRVGAAQKPPLAAQGPPIVCGWPPRLSRTRQNLKIIINFSSRMVNWTTLGVV